MYAVRDMYSKTDIGSLSPVKDTLLDVSTDRSGLMDLALEIDLLDHGPESHAISESLRAMHSHQGMQEQVLITAPPDRRRR
jgi:hypothetical protein